MLEAFGLSEVQMGRKDANFCYLVNCSNMLFERILLHLAVSLQTSDSTHDLVLSPVESVFVYTPDHNVESV